MAAAAPDMQLYFSPSSPFVRRARIVAEEKGLTDRIELVRKPIRLLQPNRDVIEKNPVAKVPVLIAPNGEAISDSTSICAYLDSIGKGPVLAAGSWRRQTLNSIGLGLCDTALQRYRELIRPEGYVLDELLDEFDLKISSTLSYLNKHVDELTDPPFDMAHITIACGIGYLDYRDTVPNWRISYSALA